MAQPARLKFYFSISFFILCFALPTQAKDFGQALSDAAIERTKHKVTYDGSYFSIPYPGGDVPSDKGVCTDVVIRAYRALGIDLQKEVHEDMKSNFGTYPKNWGLTKPDTNIDHRRVPNLRVFFKRHGKELAVARSPAAYKPGDLVTWNLKTKGNLPHIGIVTDQVTLTTGNPLIVHNIGAGPKLEDILFSYGITGHYRYEPEGYGDD